MESSDSWNFDDDELELQNTSLGSCSNWVIPDQGRFTGYVEGSTSNPARSKMICHFTDMGFPENLVAKAVDENGEGNTEEVILETLLTYSAVEESRPQCEVVPINISSQELEWDSADDLSDAESSFRKDEENSEHQHLSCKEVKMLQLVDMGFPVDKVSSAMEVCDPATSIMDLMDYITAARMAETGDNHPEQEPPNVNKRKIFEEEERWESRIGYWRKKEKVSREKLKKPLVDEEPVHLPDTSIMDLLDYVTAARMAETGDNYPQQEPPNVNKRKIFEEEERWERRIGYWRKTEKVSREKLKKPFVDEEPVHLPKDMVGFGLPNGPIHVFKKNFSADMSRETKEDGFPSDDICFEVLSRVPTKFLLQSKCVSQKWHQLISDLYFMRAQSQISKPIFSGFFFQERYHWCGDDIDSISYIPVDSERKIVHKTVLDFLPENVVLLASSNNGLLCCRSCKGSAHSVIYVCNPTTKQWITLEWDGHNGNALALAPMGISSNFRLVSLHQVEIDSDDGIEFDRTYHCSFEIYSSGTREWTTSQDGCVCKHKMFKNLGVCADRTLYWLTKGNEIIMFDVENEVPRLIKKPQSQMVCTGVPESCIGESGGQLYYIQISAKGIQVWVLEDNWEPRWVLKNCISLASMEEDNPKVLYKVESKMASRATIDAIPWIDPLAFKDGLLIMTVSTNIYSYHLETRNLKELCTLKMVGSNSLTYPIVLPYNMSLMPL